MGPLAAVAGTVVLIWVVEATVKVALVPLKATAVAPVRLVPVIVTAVPAPPLVGLKMVIVGVGPGSVKLVLLVTVIGPVLAPAGTVVLIWVGEATVKVALVPLKATAVAPVRLVPVIVTAVPAAPVVGLKLVI